MTFTRLMFLWIAIAFVAVVQIDRIREALEQIHRLQLQQFRVQAEHLELSKKLKPEAWSPKP